MPTALPFFRWLGVKRCLLLADLMESFDAWCEIGANVHLCSTYSLFNNYFTDKGTIASVFRAILNSDAIKQKNRPWWGMHPNISQCCWLILDPTWSNRIQLMPLLSGLLSSSLAPERSLAWWLKDRCLEVWCWSVGITLVSPLLQHMNIARRSIIVLWCIKLYYVRLCNYLMFLSEHDMMIGKDGFGESQRRGESWSQLLRSVHSGSLSLIPTGTLDFGNWLTSLAAWYQ